LINLQRCLAIVYFQIPLRIVGCRFSLCHIFGEEFDSGSSFEHGSKEHPIVNFKCLKMTLEEGPASNYHLPL
jgi:hypothetical protein